MTEILSIDNRYGIGNNGNLLFRCSDDLKRFKELTTDKTVVMGRKTFLSLPKQRPLPNRRNIIMTTDTDFSIEGAECVNTVEQLLSAVEGTKSEDVFIIGGAEIYKLLLPYTDKIYITRFFAERPADTFFIDIDSLPNWQITQQSEDMIFEDIKYRYITYEKIK